MSYQSPSISGAPVDNTVAEWKETTTGSSGSTATASHAAGGAGTNHYICGLVASVQTYSGSEPPEALCTIKDGATPIMVFSLQSHVVDDYAPGGGPVVINFTHPIKIAANKLVSLAVSGPGMGDVAYANIWGFTV